MGNNINIMFQSSKNELICMVYTSCAKMQSVCPCSSMYQFEPPPKKATHGVCSFLWYMMECDGMNPHSPCVPMVVHDGMWWYELMDFVHPCSGM